ncbi:MAG: hypothetical protein RLY20_729 [Verrucomicrobiota bacterium]
MAAGRRQLMSAIGTTEIGPNRLVVVRFKRWRIGIEAGGEATESERDLQHLCEAAQADQRVRTALAMTCPRELAGIHPVMPGREFNVHRALGARVQLGWLTGEPIGVQLGCALGGSWRTVGLFKSRLPHGLPAQAFLMFKLIALHHGEVKMMRGEPREAAMGADGAAKGGEAQAQVIRCAPALAEAGTVGGAKGSAPSASAGFAMRKFHLGKCSSNGEQRQDAGAAGELVHSFTISLPLLDRDPG